MAKKLWGLCALFTLLLLANTWASCATPGHQWDSAFAVQGLIFVIGAMFSGVAAALLMSEGK